MIPVGGRTSYAGDVLAVVADDGATWTAPHVVVASGSWASQLETLDPAARAVRAATGMIRRFQSHVADWHKTYAIDVGLGVGICHGEAIAGNVGSPTYMNYTIIGDAVNVAARLMQNAKANEILISESGFSRLDLPAENLRPESLAPMTFKGKSAPMPVYCVRVANDA